MKRYRYCYPIKQSNFLPFPENFLFLDIETTGFHRSTTFLTIIGLAWQEQDKIIIEQWMNEYGTHSYLEQGVQEETKLLLHLEKLLSSKETLPTLIHYNGNTFDLPYLKSKYAQYKLSTSLPHCTSIDFYLYAKKYRQILGACGLKQKNMEEVFGLFRKDTLSGTKLIEVYTKGILFQNQKLLDLYLLHNKEDMEGMVFLQHLLAFHQLFEGNFTIKSWEVHQALSCLFVEIPCHFSLKHSVSREVCGIHLHIKENTLFLKIPVLSMEAKYFYPDYKNYYYLPLEDRAIHKSVATFVEKDFRQKATKETCYSKKADFFYPLPLPSNRKKRTTCLENFEKFQLFYQNYGENTAYLLCSGPAFRDCSGKYIYIKNLLSIFLQ